MKHLVKFTFGIAAAILLVAANASAVVTIADWTWETTHAAWNGNYYTTFGFLAPDVGSGLFIGHHSNINSSWRSDICYGNGSRWAGMVDYWNVGDYYQFQVDLTGYGDVTLDWDQVAWLDWAPGEWDLQYSTDNSAYTTFASYTILSNYPAWNSTTYQSKYHHSLDLSSVSAIENASTVYFRLVDSSGTAVNGGTAYGPSGYVILDNFQVSATAIPEPSTIILVGIGLVGCVLAGRRRLS